MANYTKSEILKNIPRHLKTQPGAPKTHLAYITDDEAKMLQKKNPGTPHGTRFGIPSYDFMSETGGWVSSGDAVDVGGSQPSTNTQSNLGSGLPGGSNITGTTSGTPNPHTGTGFSGGPSLVSGAPNPGYTPPPPVDTSGGGTGGDGGTGDGYQNQIDINTGSGSSGGSGSGSGSKATPLTLDQIRLFNQITGGNVDILETKGGYTNLWDKSTAGLTINDPKTMEDLKNLETKQLDTTPLNLQDKINKDYLGQDLGPFGELSLNEQGLGGTTDSGIDYGIKPNFSGDHLGVKIGASIPTNKLFNIFKEGGPVGLMSLPQGYANGGEVIEGTDTMEELTPFGGTRERVIDQVEAFDNAPHHIEEPMIGMWGEKIPLTTARRVQKYMQGMDPVKRGLIEEMMQMFSMKKMMEQQQDQQEKGQYFGPQPNEYAI